MKRSFIFLMVFALLFASCENLSKLTQFKMDFSESVTIQKSVPFDTPFSFFTPDIETNSESAFAVNNTSKDLVEQIKLTQLKLTLKSPSDGDFGFLKSISIFVSAGSDLPEIKVAWKDNIPVTAGKELVLDVTDADLQEYIKKDSFKLKLNTVTRKILGSDHQIDLYTEFLVDVKVLGL